MKKDDRYSPNHVIGAAFACAFLVVVFLGQSIWVPASRIENLYLRSVALSVSDALAAFASSTALDRYAPELRMAFLSVSGLSAHPSWDTRYYNRREGGATLGANYKSDDVGTDANAVASSQSVGGIEGTNPPEPGAASASQLSADGVAIVADAAASADAIPSATVGLESAIERSGLAQGPANSATAVADIAPASPAKAPAFLSVASLHSADKPLTVFFFGDSQVFSLGSGLSRLTGKDSPISVDFTAIHSSGFVRGDYYNWPAKLEDTFRSKSYDAAVMMLGMNDYQNFWNRKGEALKKHTPEWEAAYKEKCRAMIDIVLASVPRLYWVGMPVVKNEAYNESLSYIDSVQESLVAEYSPDLLTRVSLRDSIPGQGKPYAASLDRGGGKKLQVMADDGSHFTVEGGQLAMKPLFDLLSRDFLFTEVPVAHLPE